MVNKAIHLLQSARQSGVQIYVTNGQLQVKVSKAKGIDAKLLEEIKTNKLLLTDFLNNDNFKSKDVQPYEAALLTINRVGHSRIPLSFSQERLWFIDRLNGSLQYHIPAVLRLKGPLNIGALSEAINSIINRHEVLRTVIEEQDGRGWQKILEKDHWKLNMLDRAYFKDDNEALKEYTRQLILQPFNISKDYMLRADLVEIEKEEHILVVTMHHIASDGWSASILVKELVEFYMASVENRPPLLKPLSLQYAEFSIWQRTFLEGEILDKKLNFWKEKLSGVPALELPTDYNRPADLGINGASFLFKIQNDLLLKLHELSQQNGASIFMTLLTGFKILFSRYSRQNDICVGTPIAGRQYPELEGLIGFFINMLAIRTDIASDQSFQDNLQKVRTNTIEAFEHQEVPFEKVVEAVVNERDLSRNPLFQVMFVFQNNPEVEAFQLPGVELINETPILDNSKYDLSFNLKETKTGLHGMVSYNTDLYGEDTISKLTGHFINLLNSIVSNPNQAVGLLNIINSDEKSRILKHINHSEVVYPADKNFVQLFEQQVIETPNVIALVFEETRLSYRQLNEKANQLAHYLVGKGVKTEDLIPICFGRSADMIVALLAILKAGGAYVPISPDYPVERIEYMLEDTRASIVVSDECNRHLLPPSMQVISPDSDAEIMSQQPVCNLNLPVLPSNLCYVIYTSGSTGRPKGVMIEHKALLDHCFGLIKSAGLKDCHSFALYSPLVFDAGHSILFTSFLRGAALHILSDELIADGKRLAAYVSGESIDCIKIVPSPWLAYTNDNSIVTANKVMIFGGEPFALNIIDKLKSIGYSGVVFNHYGPTETTIGKCIHQVDFNRSYQSVPIGKPFSNTRLYILDSFNNPVSIGVAGELHIAGDGLARGYLNLPVLTGDKFINDPYSAEAGANMYKTGDLCRWLPDGNVEYLGRMDDQVKMRGYRIELGEIEAVLLQSGLVKQAVVLAKQDSNGGKRLVGYVIPVSIFEKQAVVNYLQNKLPDYMVPAQWVQMEIFPLNANGKIDRKALPEPGIDDQSNKEYHAPQNELEATLVTFWQNLLRLDEVGVSDNFFDLGGHSLMIMRLISAIRKEFQVELHIKDVFLNPTIKKLAVLINQKKKSVLLPEVKPVKARPAQIPLSYSQERLWFIDRLEGTASYHIPAVLKMKGDLNIKALQLAFQSIIERHEVLRTVFLEKDGLSFQVVNEPGNFELPIFEDEAFTSKDFDIEQYIKDFNNKPFDLSKDTMLRAGLLVMGHQEYMLLVTLHHIASDAWSRTILVNEVAEFYNAHNEKRVATLKPLPIQYADFVLWQRSYLTGELLSQKLDFWKNQLKDVPVLELLPDFKRTPFQNYSGALKNFDISKEVYEKLLVLSSENECTLFMTLLTAFNIFLSKYTGQSDICVGTPIAGRQQQELEGLIGFFVNTLALRSQVPTDISFIQLMSAVKKTTLDAFEYGEVPFEKVVDAVVKKRDVSHSPLFQVMFVLQNDAGEANLGIGNLKLSGMGIPMDLTKFDLSLLVAEKDNLLKVCFEYKTSLFKKETIERMAGHFAELLHSIVTSPGLPVTDLQMLMPAEKELLLQSIRTDASIEFSNENIIGLFEKQVVQTPDAIALVFEGDQLTYNELNKKANQVAHYLVEKGVKENDLVPICLDRGINLIIGILAILKAGAAYVPIDLEYPEERINFMLKDIDANILISNGTGKTKLTGFLSVDTINLDDILGETLLLAFTNLNTNIAPNSLAYIIYTSGSTGQPKGVMVEHKNVVSLIKGVDYVALDKNVVLLSTGSPSFDATTFEYWGMLLNGGKLVMCSEITLLNSDLLKDEIQRNKINMMWFTAGWFNQLVESKPAVFEGLNTILVGGEKLSESHISKVKKIYPALAIINGYGPTENTTFSLTYNIKDQQADTVIAIGKPLNNRKAIILDKQGLPVPIGIAGELHLAGAGLCRGYLNQPELTAQKFICDNSALESNERFYKTGDLCRLLADGNIEYIGRIDEQVKIRGYRIELGEIETVLLQSGLVSQAVVLAKADASGSKRLIGYAVVEKTFDRQAIVNYLRGKLPGYMVPAFWMPLENFPLTSNGKIDRKALPDPDVMGMLDNKYQPPVSELEKCLVTLWQDLLGIEQIGINDNFFELGGDSILTIQVVSRFSRLGYSIQPKDIFVNQTIGQLSEIIVGRSADIVVGEQGILSGSCGLLPIQQWYLQQDQKDVSHFNQSLLLSIDKSVTSKVLGEAYIELINQHDALRFCYQKNADGWLQQYGLWQPQLFVEQLQETNKQELAIAITNLADKYQGDLSIEKGDIVRAVLIQTPAEDSHNRLLLVVHHLAIDGVSWRILLEDLEEFLSNIANADAPVKVEKTSSYRQWYNALEQYSTSPPLLNQAPFWVRATENFKPLPSDHTATGFSVRDVQYHTARLPKDQTQLLLQEVSKVYHTEINDLLLAALTLTLANYSGSQTVSIGMEGHGREAISDNINTSRTVGWFTTIYPLSIFIEPADGLDSLIKLVKEQLRQVPDKGLGYGVLKYINQHKNLTGPQPWDVVFNYLGQFDNVVNKSKWFSGAGESSGKSRSQKHIIHDKISIGSFVQSGELIFNWGYSTRHFENSTIQFLANELIKNLENLLAHCLLVKEKGETIYTPSDFNLSSELTYKNLDRFLDEKIGLHKRRMEIDGMYRLSGLQEAMLFHSLFQKEQGSYINHFGCDLIRPDIAALQKAWQHIIQHHTILRSGFYIDAFNIPVQCVYKDVVMPFDLLDFSDYAKSEQDEAIKRLEIADRKRGFDFKNPPLIRITLCRLNNDRYRMLWSSHHILYDGWSLPILMEEFLTNYESLVKGENIIEQKEDKYEDYIRYLEGINKDAEKKAWMNYLSEVEESTLLPLMSDIKTVGNSENFITKFFYFDSETSTQVQQFAQKNRLTVNTLMQGAYAILLHHYTGSEKIVFGITASGRPGSLENIEKRVGMFINTIPLYANVAEDQSVVDWLINLLTEQVSLREYQYTMINDIQKWLGIKGEWFNTTLTFQNFPLSKVIGATEWSLKVENIVAREQNNIPLSLTISNAEQIIVRMMYDNSLVQHAFALQLWEHFQFILKQIISLEGITIHDIKLVSDEEEQNILKEYVAQ